MKNTRALTSIGVLMSVIILLSLTPLGFIPLGFTKATTVHIPVIIGAIFLGRKAGLMLGASFGVMSIIINTTTPSLTSFVFSPFITVGDASGNIFSIIIALVPRMLIAVFAYYTYVLMQKFTKNKTLIYTVTGVVGSITNTVFVMSFIYIFFGSEYAVARAVESSALFDVILGIVLMNGIPEAIVSGILVASIAKVLDITKIGGKLCQKAY